MAAAADTEGAAAVEIVMSSRTESELTSHSKRTPPGRIRLYGATKAASQRSFVLYVVVGDDDGQGVQEATECLCEGANELVADNSATAEDAPFGIAAAEPSADSPRRWAIVSRRSSTGVAVKVTAGDRASALFADAYALFRSRLRVPVRPGEECPEKFVPKSVRAMFLPASDTVVDVGNDRSSGVNCNALATYKKADGRVDRQWLDEVRPSSRPPPRAGKMLPFPIHVAAPVVLLLEPSPLEDGEEADTSPFAPAMYGGGSWQLVDADVLVYVPRDAPAGALAAALLRATGRQCRQWQRRRRRQTHARFQALHFAAAGGAHSVALYTRLVDRHEQQDRPESIERRRSLLAALALPTTRATFRRERAHRASLPRAPAPSSSSAAAARTARDGRLVSPHEALLSPPADVPHGVVRCVDGDYVYYHYLQQRFDDSGWGCAYRSLQTIVSWCRRQRYTRAAVPDHAAIQRALVDMQDKPPSFVGSREWIGANEVCYVLEHLTSLKSRIMHLPSGAEIMDRARELLQHFEDEGSPVMIGGGVLAYTILGVCFDERIGEARFLVLDPHYTGGERLDVVTSKGWCGWKKPELFRRDSFYNLCLPQRPTTP